MVHPIFVLAALVTPTIAVAVLQVLINRKLRTTRQRKEVDE